MDLDLLDYPLVVLVASLLSQWLAAFAGRYLSRHRRRAAADTDEQHSHIILSAALTLLALLIGFSFSMAVSRYDQRKNYEEAEANAIGTEYLRADLLPAPAAAQVRRLLVSYAGERILHYEERDPDRLRRIEAETARLQAALWSAVTPAANALATSNTMLAAAGMNDVINSQGYTQAAWWNRIPTAAWILMFAVAVACSALLGRFASRAGRATVVTLTLLLSIALFLIADIDSPRRGIIRVAPQNMIAALRSLPPQPPQPPPN